MKSKQCKKRLFLPTNRIPSLSKGINLRCTLPRQHHSDHAYLLTIEFLHEDYDVDAFITTPQNLPTPWKKRIKAGKRKNKE